MCPPLPWYPLPFCFYPVLPPLALLPSVSTKSPLLFLPPDFWLFPLCLHALLPLFTSQPLTPAPQHLYVKPSRVCLFSSHLNQPWNKARVSGLNPRIFSPASTLHSFPPYHDDSLWPTPLGDVTPKPTFWDIRGTILASSNSCWVWSESGFCSVDTPHIYQDFVHTPLGFRADRQPAYPRVAGCRLLLQPFATGWWGAGDTSKEGQPWDSLDWTRTVGTGHVRLCDLCTPGSSC